MNWAGLLEQIRVDLNDTASTKRFSDAQLYLWTVDAIRDYSLYLPRFVERHRLTKQGNSYVLPNDFLRDVFVECPMNNFLECQVWKPGRRFYEQSRPHSYSIISGKLYLDAPTDDDVLLTYEALHTVPASASDNVWVSTFPDRDVELIRLYVKAKALEMIRAQQSNLDRFIPGSGNRQDNPLHPEVSTIMNDYRSKLLERCAGNSIRLYRIQR